MFATLEVVNQPFALADYNLFTGDQALQDVFRSPRRKRLREGE
jgi:hypothetical protein